MRPPRYSFSVRAPIRDVTVAYLATSALGWLGSTPGLRPYPSNGIRGPATPALESRKQVRHVQRTAPEPASLRDEFVRGPSVGERGCRGLHPSTRSALRPLRVHGGRRVASSFRMRPQDGADVSCGARPSGCAGSFGQERRRRQKRTCRSDRGCRSSGLAWRPGLPRRCRSSRSARSHRIDWPRGGAGVYERCRSDWRHGRTGFARASGRYWRSRPGGFRGSCWYRGC